MLFTLIFLGLLLVGWLICAYVPWVVASVVTHGHAGLRMLPLCLLAGLVAAVAVPLLGADDGGGLIASFAVAAAVPGVLLVAQRATRGIAHRSPSARVHSEQPE